MIDIGQTFVLGALIGGIFGIIGLNAPVPPTLSGFMGIAGLFVGAWLGSRLG